jgi:hypothetical protein
MYTYRKLRNKFVPHNTLTVVKAEGQNKTNKYSINTMYIVSNINSDKFLLTLSDRAWY